MPRALTASSAVLGAPDVRRIGLADIGAALRDGLADFKAIPTQLVFLGLIYPVIGVIAARAATDDLMPLLFPLFTGVSLMGPVLAIGTYELSRRRQAGLPTTWLNAFDVLRSPAFMPILLMGVVLLAIFTAWLVAARAIYNATLGPATPDSLGALLDAVLHTGAGHKLLIYGNLAGAGFALVVFTLSVVTFPMLLDRNCGVRQAVRTSVHAVLRNPAPMVAWGLVVAALLLAGSIPLFVGLAVTMPILGHATWHLYKRVVI